MIIRSGIYESSIDPGRRTTRAVNFTPDANGVPIVSGLRISIRFTLEFGIPFYAKLAHVSMKIFCNLKTILHTYNTSRGLDKKQGPLSGSEPIGLP